MLPNLSATDLMGWLDTMLLIRRFEERLVLLTQEGHSFGHFHLYVGQEVTGVLALSWLHPGDVAFTTHRNHGHLLARGADPGRLLAEILGRASGYNGGKGGTLHAVARDLGFPSTSAIVGGLLPLSAGAALTARQLQTGGVVACLFGDGALEEGAFFESINIASLWTLPVIFLCENNSLEAPGQKAGEYPSSTIAVADLADAARPFRLPAASVDGTDAAAVYTAMQDAVKRARSGAGPSFIEARTVRWPGSRPLWPALLTGETDLEMAWDPARIPAEYETWHRTQDGLLRFLRELLQARVATPAEVLARDVAARQRVEDAVAFALASPLPRPEAAEEGVFAP